MTASRIATFGAAAVLLLALAGCAGGSSVGAAGGQTSAPSASEQGIVTRNPSEKFASSQREWTAMNLQYAKSDVNASDSQIAILERSVQAGGIAVSDYEKAWANYKRCVTDKGQPEPELNRYANGLYAQRGLRGSPEKAGAFYSASIQCHTAEVLYVTMAYNSQVDNPNLYQDPHMQMADCLRRAEIVPKSYAADDYSRELRTGEYSYDELAPEARACEVASNIAVGHQNDAYQDVGW